MAENKVTEGVSTHSRTEAAAPLAPDLTRIVGVSTHSRTEAAAFNDDPECGFAKVSTHSRTEAAACVCLLLRLQYQSFNTQPHGGGCHISVKFDEGNVEFQHTAARRRLLKLQLNIGIEVVVSTHSRTEAAAN